MGTKARKFTRSGSAVEVNIDALYKAFNRSGAFDSEDWSALPSATTSALQRTLSAEKVRFRGDAAAELMTTCAFSLGRVDNGQSLIVATASLESQVCKLVLGSDIVGVEISVDAEDAEVLNEGRRRMLQPPVNRRGFVDRNVFKRRASNLC